MNKVSVNGNRALIEEIAEEQKTESGIILPNQKISSVKKGKIVARGVGGYGVDDGKIVLYKSDSVIPITLNGKDFHLIEFGDILIFEE